MSGVFSTYSADVPQVFLDLDRTKAELLQVPVSRVFSTIAKQLGSRYVNDMNLLGSRVFQVKVQADTRYRDTLEDIGRIYVRSNEKPPHGPHQQPGDAHHHHGPATGDCGTTSSPAPRSTAKGAPATAPARPWQPWPGWRQRDPSRANFGYEWSALSYQERKSGGQAPILLALALLFGYLLSGGPV